MNTKQAAIGRWAEIYKHYGLHGITGKNHLKGECPLCGRKGKFRCDNKTVPGHTSACVVQAMAGRC